LESHSWNEHRRWASTRIVACAFDLAVVLFATVLVQLIVTTKTKTEDKGGNATRWTFNT
jgi:hypothetical protein